ncbi:hypothetical protein M9458_007733, partial [Cirrhinus mrigala]
DSPFVEPPGLRSLLIDPRLFVDYSCVLSSVYLFACVRPCLFITMSLSHFNKNHSLIILSSLLT